MSHYRDSLDAARARIETLEAKLNERDASLAARDAELAENRAEVARLRGEGGNDDDRPLDGLDARGGQRVLFAALALCGFATATGYAMVRPVHCHQRGAAPAVAVRSMAGSRAPLEPIDLGVTVSSETNGPAQRASRVRLGKAMVAALDAAKQRVDVCRPAGDGEPRGEGSVTVTFQPDGGSTVELGPPYDGTAVGACVAQIYRSARVPQFDGQPISLTARFDL
jgi:hypothetical protein